MKKYGWMHFLPSLLVLGMQKIISWFLSLKKQYPRGDYILICIFRGLWLLEVWNFLTSSALPCGEAAGGCLRGKKT